MTTLSTAVRLGPYEIIAPIGAGRMGEVYKARDTRLDRTVAVNVSPAQFSERFEREARAVADRKRFSLFSGTANSRGFSSRTSRLPAARNCSIFAMAN